MIQGIHHIALKCSGTENFQKTVSFYRDIIGMKILRSWGEGDDAGAMVEIGGDIIEIFASGRVEDTTGAINHFAFFTDDPDECIERVRKAGYQVTIEPNDTGMVLNTPEKGKEYPLRVAFCKGPVGEDIEFFSER